MSTGFIHNKIKRVLRRLDMKLEHAKYVRIDKLPKNIEYFDGGLYDAVYEASCKWPHNVAISYFDTEITYKEMIKKINKVASALKTFDVKKGDRITICMPNTPEAVYMFYAINEVGAVANMIHPLSSELEIEDYLNKSHSKIMLCIDIAYPKVEAILKNTEIEQAIVVSPSRSMDLVVRALYRITKGRKNHIKNTQQIFTWDKFIMRANKFIGNPHTRVDPDDDAVIMYSGGTTGKPKGIVLSNLNFNAQALGAKYLLPEMVRTENSYMAFLPNFHAFGLGVCIHLPLYFGSRTVLIPQFNAKKFKTYLKKYKINILVGVPTVFEYLTKIKFGKKDLSGMKVMVCGGDMMSGATKNTINEFVAAHGSRAVVQNGYGLTEASGGFILSTPSLTDDPDAIGFTLAGNEAIIIDPRTHEEVPTGEEGEIVVRGVAVMKRYLDNPEATEDAFIKVGTKKYLRTGDIGYVDKKRIFHFKTRLKRMIITNGYNVYPTNIEDITKKCELIENCAVVGQPDDLRGQKVVVFIVAKKDIQERIIKKELNNIYKKHLAKYEIPREIRFLPELPQTKLAKIDFKVLESME